ncbi:MAG: enoyl-CoA hydratase/isomerase family protein [Bacteroidales bacterium]|jgi:enoyl-CoA hydratase/carnithine racemase|nr:enoyl-CoA hydratase/isomerase family protein [Bacteroidales bacterium]
MDYKTISLQSVDNTIKVITLNYPSKLNVLSQLFFDEFNEILEFINRDKNIKVLIIKGSETVFSAGGDLKEMLDADYEKSYQMCVRAQKSFESLMSLEIPVIAALDGLVYGGGFEMSLHCDIRFCTPETVFKLPEVDLGLIPGSGGISIFSKFFSISDAAYYLYTGEQIPVEEAYKKGLVQKIVSRDDLYNFTLEFAKTISTKPKESISTIKRILFAGLFSNVDNCLKMESLEFSSVLQRVGKERIKDFFQNKKNK